MILIQCYGDNICLGMKQYMSNVYSKMILRLCRDFSSLQYQLFILAFVMLLSSFLFFLFTFSYIFVLMWLDVLRKVYHHRDSRLCVYEIIIFSSLFSFTIFFSKDHWYTLEAISFAFQTFTQYFEMVINEKGH